MAAASTDLTPLNDYERTALRLLAQGHTVKSIASLTGRSEASVNERLREARRKTGIGSSRELARLFAAQENRDGEIGVAAAPDGEPVPPAPAAAIPARGMRKAQIAMTLFGATAALALVTQTAPQTGTDPVSEVIGSEEMTPPRLHERLARETRDPVWAPATEAALRSYYMKGAPLVPGSLRIVCARTLCEATGLVGTAAPRKLDRSIRFLQAAPPVAEPRVPGLDGQISFSVGNQADGKAVRFVVYWRRGGG